MKPYTTNEELPEPKVKKDKKTGVVKMVEYAEARYFLRMTPVSYELIKVFKKPTGVLRRHCTTMKRNNKAHMAQFKKLKEAGIPVIA
jgi:hypothetical protein